MHNTGKRNQLYIIMSHVPAYTQPPLGPECSLDQAKAYVRNIPEERLGVCGCYKIQCKSCCGYGSDCNIPCGCGFLYECGGCMNVCCFLPLSCCMFLCRENGYYVNIKRDSHIVLIDEADGLLACFSGPGKKPTCLCTPL